MFFSAVAVDHLPEIQPTERDQGAGEGGLMGCPEGLVSITARVYVPKWSRN